MLDNPIWYIYNDNNKVFDECIHKIFDLVIFISPPIKKDDAFYNTNWTKNNTSFEEEHILKDIRDGLPLVIN